MPFIYVCRHGKELSFRIGRKSDLSDFERLISVVARQVGLRISEIADLLEYPLTTISRVYKK